ncbi:pimeloyl-ACP methyl ester carboxylesterase [Yoonia maritima]|uniref:Pimeloyl-ACP methyl ester carboxylesterase n=1 Tax=Yoonia maritima TaxID=1435347 RepID=A0A2T0W3Y6_9RHOB|nr:alpha/beta hydrolase [Yoonia maritima]PRY80178.1 pimeloyl-ACP methyl ester carboxylesterase [Yoonia maritima]
MPLDTDHANNSNFTDVNGHQIAWRSTGAGQPLLMLNRFRASIDDWDPALIEALARHHQVITFDNAGVAASGGSVPETLEGAADIAMGLAKTFDLDRPHVLGWSMGGMIAQIIAAKYGDEVGGVVLAATTPSFVLEGTVPTPQEWLATATKEENTPEDMQFLFYADTEASRSAGLSSLARIGQGNATAGAASKTTMHTVGAQGAATRKFFFGEDGAFKGLNDISAPVLVANGDRDRAFAVENSLALVRAIPDAQLAIYPDAGHAFLFQNADQFSEDVTRFLAGL